MALGFETVNSRAWDEALLSEVELKTLLQWLGHFYKKYPVVGLVREYWLGMTKEQRLK